MKLRWKVCEAPTGRYRSFEHRGWPMAYFDDGRCAVALYCEQDYSGKLAKATHGLEIRINVADWSASYQSFKWRTLKQRATSLIEAKEIAQFFLMRHPEFTQEKRP